MDCRKDLKYNCGIPVNARCVRYDGDLSTDSVLEDCITVEEVIEELYDNQDSIKKSIDLSKLSSTCIDYTVYKSGDSLLVSEALQAQSDKICEILGDPDDNQNNNNSQIDLSRINTKCLLDICNVGITSTTVLIQTMIDTICALKEKIEELENEISK